MRIIAGRLGGRTFDSPHSPKTHPMSDKMRGALFNILGDIEGLTVLDPFAGTGALSLEAISRGAASALALDNDRLAQASILQNIQSLDVANEIHLVKTSADSWLQTAGEATFDLMLCDPPYDNLQSELIQKLATRLQSEGVLALSWPQAAPILQIPGLKKVAHRSYGDAQLVFYKKPD